MKVSGGVVSILLLPASRVETAQVKLCKLRAQQFIKEAELDEMWSFIGSKRNQRWLWRAFACRTD